MDDAEIEELMLERISLAELKRMGRYCEELAAARSYCHEALLRFTLYDPPDSDFQRGYLAALITISKEALGFVGLDDKGLMREFVGKKS